MDTILQNLNYFSCESIVSSSQKHEHLEENFASVAATQEVMAKKGEMEKTGCEFSPNFI